MAENSYIFYDTAPIGVTAGEVHTLFQSAQGSAAARTKNVTNWIGAGSIPSDNEFIIRKIMAILNDTMVEADMPLLWEQTFIEVFINNRTVFLAPLVTIVAATAVSGLLLQAAPAVEAQGGPMGNGYPFDPVNTLDGGVQFKVEVTQNALLSAITNVTIALEGVWTRPD